MYSREELDQVAREAARAVLRDLGVPSDEKELAQFRIDLHEGREFVAAFREAKRVVWRTVVKWATVLALAAMAAGVGVAIHDKIK